MKMYDLIMKKKQGYELTNDEITFMINGYTKGEIPDYQMSAMAMAICFQGMTAEETKDDRHSRNQSRQTQHGWRW